MSQWYLNGRFYSVLSFVKVWARRRLATWSQFPGTTRRQRISCDAACKVSSCYQIHSLVILEKRKKRPRVSARALLASPQRDAQSLTSRVQHLDSESCSRCFSHRSSRLVLHGQISKECLQVSHPRGEASWSITYLYPCCSMAGHLTMSYPACTRSPRKCRPGSRLHPCPQGSCPSRLGPGQSRQQRACIQRLKSCLQRYIGR